MCHRIACGRSELWTHVFRCTMDVERKQNCCNKSCVLHHIQIGMWLLRFIAQCKFFICVWVTFSIAITHVVHFMVPFFFLAQGQRVYGRASSHISYLCVLKRSGSGICLSFSMVLSDFCTLMLVPPMPPPPAVPPDDVLGRPTRVGNDTETSQLNVSRKPSKSNPIDARYRQLCLGSL